MPNYRREKDNTLKSRVMRHNGKLQYQCPECGRWVMDFQLLKVKRVDLTPHDWACDACWTSWRRNKKPVKAGKEHLSEDDWFCEFIEELDINHDEWPMHRRHAKKELNEIAAQKILERGRPGINPSDQAKLDAEINKINAKLNGKYKDD